MGCIEDVVGGDYDVELKWAFRDDQIVCNLGNGRSFIISQDNHNYKHVLHYETPTDTIRIGNYDDNITTLMNLAKKVYSDGHITLEIR